MLKFLSTQTSTVRPTFVQTPEKIANNYQFVSTVTGMSKVPVYNYNPQ